VLGEGWDDFKKLTVDSTAVEGNVLWPTDSRLMVDLVARLYQRGERLNPVGLPNFVEPRMAKVLGAMSLLDREISLGSGRPQGARKRPYLYRKLLKKARRATALLAPQVELTNDPATDTGRVGLRPDDVSHGFRCQRRAVRRGKAPLSWLPGPSGHLPAPRSAAMRN